MPLKPMSATWNRAQEFGQPLTLMVIGVSKSGSRRLEFGADRLGAPLRLDDRELAELDAGAGDRAAMKRRRRTVEAHVRTRRQPFLDAVRRTSSTTRPCCAVSRTRPPRVPIERARSATSDSARTRRAAGLRRGADADAAVAAAASTPTWSRCATEMSGAGPSGSARSRYSFSSTSRNRASAPVGDQELEPGVVARAAVAVVAKDRRDAGPDLGDLVRFDEDTEPLGEHRVGRQTAADPEVEARRARRAR